ncbi:lysophospholipid acyltransferase family protein [Acholeplasma granularum]|uniref:lysophospholipid acyltransferase family protein n=1 Tax=Acholeplasma granularum TaxID=264635 RepID=UPI000472ABF8|nr:lysophospholipid acyltransferase family protein [Acholeplasma granularum]
MSDNKNKVKHEYDIIKNVKKVELKDGYTFFNHNPFFKFASFILIILIKILAFYVYGIVFRGLRIKGKKNLKHLKNNRFILVSNHVHILDAIWIGTLIFPRKIYVTMLKSNLGLPYVGKILRLAGGIPIPETKEHMVHFLDELKTELSKKTPVLVMPEASIKPYHVGIRKFLSGAFRFAADSDAKILPFVYVYKKPNFIQKLYIRKPRIHLHVLEPIDVVLGQNKHETLQLTKDKVHQVMSDYFNEHSDIKE